MTTRSPATAPIVTLVLSFVIVFGLGQAIGGPETGRELPQNPSPTTAPADPGAATVPAGPPELTQPTDPPCPLEGVLVGRKNEPVFCPPSGQTTWHPHQYDPHHGQEDQ